MSLGGPRSNKDRDPRLYSILRDCVTELHILRRLQRHFVCVLSLMTEMKKKLELTTIQFVKRIQNDVQDDVMPDAKLS